MLPPSSGSPPAVSETEPLRVRFAGYELDEANASLLNRGARVPLAPKAFDVLCAMARHAGRLVSKNTLLDAVWGHQHVSESVLKTVVSELREALGEDPRQPRIIETVSRRGYRFIALLAPVTAAAPPGAGDSPVTLMVGRDDAMTRLTRCWRRAVSGHRQIVWIAGEAGIGKTTLMEQFAATLRTTRRAHGQCVEQYGAGEPYLPVLDGLGALAREDPRIVPLLRTFAPTWLLQLPWLSSTEERECLRRELANVGQERMLREFGELLERYAGDEPVLLTTEDLHWSDPATVHLINHVARRRGHARFMWLASFRLAEVVAAEGPLQALRHELRLHQLCEEIILEPLSERDTADYLRRRLGERDSGEELVRALHARTDGLPLFLVNVVDDLVTGAGVPAQPQGIPASVTAAWNAPQSLMGIIERQMARLPVEHQDVLQAASVIGLEFSSNLVAEILDQDPQAVGSACEAIARQGQWLTEAKVTRGADGALDARHAFRHSLYRHMLYQSLGALRRSQWHARAARGLERLLAAGQEVTSAELATHYERSRQTLPAVRHYAEAAAHAMRLFAPGEALTLAQVGLDLLGQCAPDAQRDALELQLHAMQGAAAAQHLGVGTRQARLAFERARVLLARAPRHPLRGMVLHALGIVLLVQGEYAQVVTLGEHLHELARREGDCLLLLSACSVLGQAHALQGSHAQACAWLSAGVRAGESVSDAVLRAAFVVDPLVTIYAALAVPLLHLGRVDEARRSREAAFTRADKVREPMARLVAHWFGCLLAVRLEESARVAAWALQLARLAEEAALAQGHAPARWFGAWARAALGTPAGCEPDIMQGLTLSADLGLRSGGSEVLAYAAEVLIAAGDWTAASHRLDEAEARAGEFGEWVYLTQTHLLRARIARARGDTGMARQAARAALGVARAQAAPWLELMALTAVCDMETPDLDDVRALRQLLATLPQGRDSVLYRRAESLIARQPLR